MSIDLPFPSNESFAERSTPAEHAAVGDRLWLTLGATALVLVVTTALLFGYAAVVGGSPAEPPAGPGYGAAGIGLVAAFGLLWWRFDEDERRAAFPLRRPSRAELGWAVGCFPLGIGAFTAGEWLAARFGFELAAYYGYDLVDPATIAGVLFGAVLVAPIVEELLFRGALISVLLGRGRSMIAAGIGSIALFAGYHVFALGVAGVVAIAAWAVFPTILRVRFDNLAGAWLLHLLNNVYAYVIFAGFIA